MKNIAVIFAGGTGTRMGNTEKPKQFLEIDGKPIIVHTIEKFNDCSQIDAISISILDEYVEIMTEIVTEYNLNKVEWIVSGGETGQLSIFNGIEAVQKDERVDKDAIILIHDGVRPIIDEELILKNIAKTRTSGSAVTVVKATETLFSTVDHESIESVLDRDLLYHARAPQTFFLEEVYSVHKKEMGKKIYNNIDTCTMMHKYGHKINTVIGKTSNIKITNYEDYYIFKTLYELDKDRKEGERLS